MKIGLLSSIAIALTSLILAIYTGYLFTSLSETPAEQSMRLPLITLAVLFFGAALVFFTLAFLWRFRLAEISYGGSNDFSLVRASNQSRIMHSTRKVIKFLSEEIGPSAKIGHAIIKLDNTYWLVHGITLSPDAKKWLENSTN